MHGLAAAVFLGMAILFLGIAIETNMSWAWVLAMLNSALSALNLIIYFGHEDARRE